MIGMKKPIADDPRFFSDFASHDGSERNRDAGSGTSWVFHVGNRPNDLHRGSLRGLRIVAIHRHVPPVRLRGASAHPGSDRCPRDSNCHDTASASKEANAISGGDSTPVILKCELPVRLTSYVMECNDCNSESCQFSRSIVSIKGAYMVSNESGFSASSQTQNPSTHGHEPNAADIVWPER